MNDWSQQLFNNSFSDKLKKKVRFFFSWIVSNRDSWKKKTQLKKWWIGEIKCLKLCLKYLKSKIKKKKLIWFKTDTALRSNITAVAVAVAATTEAADEAVKFGSESQQQFWEPNTEDIFPFGTDKSVAFVY